SQHLIPTAPNLMAEQAGRKLLNASSPDELAQILQDEPPFNAAYAKCQAMPMRMAMTLSTALAMNQRLLELDLVVDSSSALALQGIAQNATLRTLSLHATHLGTGGELAVAVKEILRKNATLQTLRLDMDGSNLCERKGVALAEALQQNASLRSVDISTRHTRIGDGTGVALAEALWVHDVLRHFGWAADGTTISDRSGTTLAQALQQNMGLESFRFSALATELSDESGLAMAEAVATARSLQVFSLNVSETRLCDVTGQALAASLQGKHLRSFAFTGNFCGISDETCQAMANAIGTTSLSFEFIALHLFISEATSLKLRWARENAGVEINFQVCQLDGGAFTPRQAIQEAKDVHSGLGECPMTTTDLPSTPCDGLGAMEREHGDAFKSKLSDSLSETDCGEEAVTISSTDTPAWESLHGISASP
ncbi:unnamed protein product, partial [Effrenium voratum]